MFLTLLPLGLFARFFFRLTCQPLLRSVDGNGLVCSRGAPIQGHTEEFLYGPSLIF